MLLALLSLLAAGVCVEVLLRFATRRELGRDFLWRVPLLPLVPDAESLVAMISKGPAAPGGYLTDDPEIGWIIGPSAGSGPNTSNSQGARAPHARIYEPAVPAGKFRLLTFGDSFTHGDEVGMEETWQHVMEQMSPGLEVVNFGVPAYGMDQALLRCRREMTRLSTNAALLCVWPEDIARSMNVYRFFLTGAADYLQKPRFVVTPEGAAQLLNSPIDGSQLRLLERLKPPLSLPASLLAAEHWRSPGDLESRWWHGWHTARVTASVLRMFQNRQELKRVSAGAAPEAQQIAVALARMFVEEVRAKGAEPLVVLIPKREDLATYPGGERPLPLVRQWLDAGLPVLDLSPSFAARGLEGLFLPSGHMTKDGNEVIAATLHAHFDRR